MNTKNLSGKKKLAIGVSATAAVLLIFYILFAFSNIPFIKKCRTLYIETALDTMSHQWLATALLPRSVVDGVLAERQARFDGNMTEESQLPPAADPVPSPLPTEAPADPRESLLELFYELDPDTLPEGLDYEDMQMSGIEELGIMTLAGDAVYAIDVPNKLMIVSVKGEGYVGKLAIVRSSAQVALAVNENPAYGKTVTQLCEGCGAVLGVNASGFYDPEGVGDGGMPHGLAVSGGEQLYDAVGGQYQVAGFDWEDNFRIGYGVDAGQLRDAMQFYPILILNGEKQVEGSFGMGIQPRTAIGQTEDKSALLLVIDGRQIHSIGATVGECADILLRYGCFNAMNMDGGSSSSMTYMGEMITKTSSPSVVGRTLPDAWVVLPPEGE